MTTPLPHRYDVYDGIAIYTIIAKEIRKLGETPRQQNKGFK